MPSPSPSDSAPRPEDFRPENFRQQAGFRDYVIYAILATILLGVAGGAANYFTRSPAEQVQLKAKFRHMLGKVEPDDPKPIKLKLKAPKLEGIMEPDSVPAVTETKTEAARPTGGSSAYAGGGPTKILPSDDPKAPPASPEFLEFATTLKIKGVLQGNPAKAMLNGRLFRVGESISAELGVTFASVDPVKKFLLLRDQSGAELRVSY
jgi:hypothetical protein